MAGTVLLQCVPILVSSSWWPPLLALCILDVVRHTAEELFTNRRSSTTPSKINHEW
ncbi:hypothetical protein BKA82DRAFT_1008377, partial [Pisolithus tinctorius]